MQSSFHPSVTCLAARFLLIWSAAYFGPIAAGMCDHLALVEKYPSMEEAKVTATVMDVSIALMAILVFFRKFVARLQSDKNVQPGILPAILHVFLAGGPIFVMTCLSIFFRSWYFYNPVRAFLWFEVALNMPNLAATRYSLAAALLVSVVFCLARKHLVAWWFLAFICYGAIPYFVTLGWRVP